jgi:Protein of unknown function (DUF2939)
MRILVRGAIALVILIAAYWGWALAGAAQLAWAAQRGDAQAVMERLDLQAVIRSLAGQISRAFLDENPQLQKRQGLVLNGSAAEMLLRAFVTPETITALLNQGRVSVPNVNGSGATTVWNMPSFGDALSSRPWEVILNSHPDGLGRFVVGLQSPDGLYRVHMTLSGLTWLLSGVDIPEPVTARLAKLIAERIGGAVDIPTR